MQRGTVVAVNSLQESHHSRRKREIAEKQVDDGRKFSLFAERKYQTLVSIFQELRVAGAERTPGLLCFDSVFFSALELQHERELCEHQVPAAGPGQQGLPYPALEVVEQHISRGVALPRVCPLQASLCHQRRCFQPP